MRSVYLPPTAVDGCGVTVIFRAHENMDTKKEPLPTEVEILYYFFRKKSIDFRNFLALFQIFLSLYIKIPIRDKIRWETKPGYIPIYKEGILK